MRLGSINLRRVNLSYQSSTQSLSFFRLSPGRRLGELLSPISIDPGTFDFNIPIQQHTNIQLCLWSDFLPLYALVARLLSHNWPTAYQFTQLHCLAGLVLLICGWRKVQILVEVSLMIGLQKMMSLFFPAFGLAPSIHNKFFNREQALHNVKPTETDPKSYQHSTKKPRSTAIGLRSWNF